MRLKGEAADGKNTLKDILMAFVPGQTPVAHEQSEQAKRDALLNEGIARRAKLLTQLSEAEKAENTGKRAGVEIGDIRSQKLQLELKAEQDLAKQHEESLTVLQKYNREKEGIDDPQKLSRLNALQSLEKHS